VYVQVLEPVHLLVRLQMIQVQLLLHLQSQMVMLSQEPLRARTRALVLKKI
jgi:hypothetical protein